MKRFGRINIGILPLLLEALSPAYGQHNPREQEGNRPNQEQEARPQKQREQGRPEAKKPPPQRGRGPEEAKPGRPAQQARPGRQGEPNRARVQPERSQVEAKGQQEQRNRPERSRVQPEPGRRLLPQPSTSRQAPRASREYEGQHRSTWPERRAHNWRSEHRTWQDRGGYNGFRIPDARYRASFGPGHWFRMYSFPLVMVGGFPRFEFGGLWFGVMDPWPEYWSDDWYGSDDLYIEYFGGGYYLHNRRHPYDRIAITVYLN
jgi:hypothetical protein